MSTSMIESFDDVALWTARDPAGDPSANFSITTGGPARGPWRQTPTATVTATTGALDHHLDRIGPPLDLTGSTDIVLWVRSDRAADGSPQRPFFAEVRLGSAALGAGAPGNDWHRFIDLAATGTWQQVPMALADLSPQVRSGVTELRLTCVDAERTWTLGLDRIIAVRDELLTDTDAALQGRLNDRIHLGGGPVPAFVSPAPATPEPPYFRLSNYDLRPNRGRAPGAPRRADHTRAGYTLRPPADPFDVYYTVEAVTDDRADAAAMLDFAVAEFVPTVTVESGARLATVDWVDTPPWIPPSWISPPIPPQPGGAPDVAVLAWPHADRPVIHLRVSTGRAPAGAAQPAVPIFNVIEVEVEQRVRR